MKLRNRDRQELSFRMRETSRAIATTRGAAIGASGLATLEPAWFAEWTPATANPRLTYLVVAGQARVMCYIKSNCILERRLATGLSLSHQSTIPDLTIIRGKQAPSPWLLGFCTSRTHRYFYLCKA